MPNTQRLATQQSIELIQRYFQLKALEWRWLTDTQQAGYAHEIQVLDSDEQSVLDGLRAFSRAHHPYRGQRYETLRLRRTLSRC